jgi:hypothetical protein
MDMVRHIVAPSKVISRANGMGCGAKAQQRMVNGTGISQREDARRCK